ncbi:MAG: FAD-dependent oxidoreductase [Bacteroidales bacterium]|jgi:glycine/D-amino acid oxidase-like deaminating enzyme/Fe-S-cluster-containing hydrogenase component 2|nr:FAD-dependent oxidoreductase [Bacteroidales bacterium]
MKSILNHPILEIESGIESKFLFNGQVVTGKKGYTIAAALHQAGYPIHSHSISGRERGLACGIGKCGACEMLVDGKVRRICITKVDNVQQVEEIPQDYQVGIYKNPQKEVKIHKTTVAIIGAGPAGLACREKLNEFGVSNIVIDNNATIGGQFNMQTHQFFFFEKEKKYGGMRGFEIAKTLAGDNHTNILLNMTVWDIVDDKRIVCKNLENDEISYIDASYIVVATGAIPFSPSFENDDLPGVYTAAVFQKMMNQEHTLLGKNVLTIGAGNIGYLTSYQGMQAGAKIKAIIEAQPHEGGFPVQANRVRRLGIPIMTSYILVKAVPNETHTGIIGAIIAQCKDFKPVAGTEKLIDGIDIINICTGLIPDNQLLELAKEKFKDKVYAAGDVLRIGEGTSAVLRGKQTAFEIIQDLGLKCDYNQYLSVSKEYIESQQHPFRVLNDVVLPAEKRRNSKPFVLIDCLYGFACNPCAFSCPHGAISKTTTSQAPQIDYDKCIGCMECVHQCPGLAIFGYSLSKNWIFFPVEYFVNEKEEVFLVDNNGQKVGEGVIEKILKKPNKTNVARVKATDIFGENLLKARGFILKADYPQAVELKDVDYQSIDPFICHCDDVTLEQLLAIVKDRRFVSIDELKHTIRIGMGSCRGKRCIPRVRLLLRSKGIELVGDSTPRGPMANPVLVGDLLHKKLPVSFLIGENQAVKKTKVKVLVAGGGIAGSALFRYFAEEGLNPLLINADRGASWRNIAGGRPAFSNPDIADIALHNLEIFKDIQKDYDIHYRPIHYINLVHDDLTYRNLDASRAWSDAYMIEKKDFQKEISPLWNPNLNDYSHALITRDCWQATPGRVIDYIRSKGIEKGGQLLEDAQLLELYKQGNQYFAIVKTHEGEYIEYCCEHFVNALGFDAARFAHAVGIETGIYPVKHQAFITQRLNLMGIDGKALGMVIDRRNRNGFSAIYGQQLTHTGQIIGCASPACDPQETNQSLKFNTKDFLNIVMEMFASWIPNLSAVGIQATWSGYYTEPRYIVDPELGLLIGLRGHGFMLGQYLAKQYVTAYLGGTVPSYMQELKLSGKGLSESAFK